MRTVGGYDSYFYNGVHYAVDYVRNNPTYKIVINYSGGGGVSSVLESAVSYANTYGVTIVASAGNDYGGAVKYPAAYSSSYPNVVAVSATDQNDVVSSYSNAGPQINVSAPGGTADLSMPMTSTLRRRTIRSISGRCTVLARIMGTWQAHPWPRRMFPEPLRLCCQLIPISHPARSGAFYNPQLPRCRGWEDKTSPINTAMAD